MAALGQTGWPPVLGGRAVIFVTVGTQLAFDRLIMAVDQWAGKNPNESVFLQIGPGSYQPQHGEFSNFVAPDKANELFKTADLII